MKFSKYIRDKQFAMIAGFLFWVVLLMTLFLFQLDREVMIMLTVLFIIFMMTVLLWDFFRKKQFYDELLQNTKKLDKKYLVLETLQSPRFYEGELLFTVLYGTNKSMRENVKKYQCGINDFKEYIEMWIHEIKIPLASLVLMCHNNREKLDKKFIEQVRRVDQYLEQVLYYVRSEHAENDYLIKEVSLSKLITKTALNNREDLLEHEINLLVNEITQTVMTDGKWLEFILNQVMNNAIKYRAKGRQAHIKIYTEDLPDKVILHIEDNGIGISSNDLPNVFKKSFTGENGRSRAKSTGMGLYIVKRLCKKLGHTVEIKSVMNEYTDVIFTFAKNGYYKMTE